MRTFRVFISSPGDTAAERRRAENIVSRLNGEFAGLARLDTVRWETEHYGAHATFQAQIPPSVDCDVVIGILRWRLGTGLPPHFETMPDGEPYPSGTAYELLTAMEKRRSGADLPDVFVFRYTGGAPSITIGEAEEEAKRRDWMALQGFFERWFVSPQGHFLTAMNTYGSEDDFAAHVEALLRKWLADKVADGRAVPWPPAKGSPFRGLDVFGARHAPVFFGRGADIRRATELWRDASARGARFMLVVGASGAGKSSLVRAGLIPRLTTPGVVPEVDLWRIAVLRPGDGGIDGLFCALAAALLRAEADLPSGEEGRGPALPEIAEGDSKTPADLAAVLGHADDGAVKPVLNALARIAERAGKADRYRREVRSALVLLVDQAEELFAPSVAPEARDRFAKLLGALVLSGRVWLAATLRADFYASWLASPTLKALKDAGASYDLASPGAAGLAEIVRAPAAAADLVYDIDAATGEQLDEILLREADRPDMLPLVQLALTRLWEARETRGAETVLPLAAFRRLGGLEGIIDEAGETALKGLGSADRLPPLIRRLGELSDGRGGTAATVTTRAVPLTEAAPDPQSRALVDALVASRLLTLSDDAGTTAVRLAHQRVLSDWARAAAIVAESADFYRIRDDVETRRRRWEDAKRRSDLLLPRGLPLAEARAMVAKYSGELPSETRAFVAVSQRRANRAQVFGWSAAGVFAILAVGAGIEGRIAYNAQATAEFQRYQADEQRAEAIRQRTAAELERSESEKQKTTAEKNFDLAKGAIDGLVIDLAQGLDNIGLPIITRRSILETARHTVDNLLTGAPENKGLQRSQALMLVNFGTTYMAAGDLNAASFSFEESLKILRRMAESDVQDAQIQNDLAVNLDHVGDLSLQTGDSSRALLSFQETLAIVTRLSTAYGQNASFRHDIWSTREKLGDVYFATGRLQEASDAFNEGLNDARSSLGVDSNNPQAQRDVSISLEKVGNAQLRNGQNALALASFEEALVVTRQLFENEPSSAIARRDLTVAWEDIGEAKRQSNDLSGALTAYEHSIEIRRALVTQDPTNATAKLDLSVAAERVGVVKLLEDDISGALTAFQEDLENLRQLSTKYPNDEFIQRRLSVALNHVGDCSHGSDAFRFYEDGRIIAEKLLARHPNSFEAQRDVMASFSKIGMRKLAIGDQKDALVDLRKTLTIAESLALTQPSDAQAQADLTWVRGEINEIGHSLPSGDGKFP